ncbi:MAG TPA: alkaline phosphatase family protein, partial [Blastocatellia bacterium]
MTQGFDNLKHIVCLMMENRSFDHMLGSLKAVDSRINGLTGNESNPDTTGAEIKVQPLAAYQGQYETDPDHHFPGVNTQLYYPAPGPPAAPSMRGFIQDYYKQRQNVKNSHNIVYYFPQASLPVLTTLALDYAVFNGWFASIPGPTVCNRAFAHYGTSFGRVSMDPFYWTTPPLSIYERMLNAGRTAKIYYFDEQSGTLEIVNLLKNQPQLFALFDQFTADCKAGDLPDYCFVEPNYSDHQTDVGDEPASDQHPDHNVLQGERFIAQVYNAIRTNPDLWKSTVLLVVYDEHGGIYDHVPPPPCVADGVGNETFQAGPEDTGTGFTFDFDRLGLRVPAILISPWIAKGTVVPGSGEAAGRNFDHASIPATVAEMFSLQGDVRSNREVAAQTFLDLLSDE